jgi:hypothetical protein
LRTRLFGDVQDGLIRAFLDHFKKGRECQQNGS